MPLVLRWVGEEDFDRVAETRMLSYASAGNLMQRYQEGLRKDRRAKPGDFLLAERNGEAVGTSTSLSLTMWIRGAAVPCQGVAYVGTIKTARRLGGEEPGVATQLMHETLREARRRQQAVSALMPFRASYYEHFGYGNSEHRTQWTIPLSILPRGETAGFRFYRTGDLSRLMEMRQRECMANQCDIETDPAAWEFWCSHWSEGLVVVDEPTPGGPIRSLLYFGEERGKEKATLQVWDWSADSPESLRRIFHFLATLKDQYSEVRIDLPGDFPLNRMLRESQIPHRQVDHPFAIAKPYTRMQMRVLDHRRVLEAMAMPQTIKGKCALVVRESEGHASQFTIDISEGRITVSPSTHTADVEISDVLWASLISGDLSASAMMNLGLLPSSTRPEIVRLLDSFSIGPRPFCQEYF
ncbi:MAG: GNAT family N-acetyltransferase [Phycisphaerae bacterium]|nr:GNAT family N-acetyltransferase [Phycisphaerae bacterium]MDW8261896.1 GNAT family N-acetyltransferase [Phycisphaerales bacterium]